MRVQYSKISINDAIFYRFKYIFEENLNTFQAITSFINHNNSLNNKKYKKFSRTAIYKKENLLPVELYKNIFIKIKKFYDDNFKHSKSVILIDGVYSNTNINHNGKVETSMSLGFYDNSCCIPLDIHFTGEGKKNNECLSLKKYISNNIDQFKNKLIICDRAYYCYDFFNFLIENKIKFIIRLRDKATQKEPSKYTKHYDDHKKVFNNNNVRMITETFKTSKLAVNNCNNINEIKKDTIVKLLTNLNCKTYDDNKILDLYASRWNIEEFFKQYKHNFKFQNLIEHKVDNYKKNIYASLTITIIKQILMNYYEKIKSFNNKTIISKNNKSIKIKQMINENLVLAGIKNVLLRDMIYQKLNDQIINSFLSSHIIVYYNEEGRHFERKSKRPFTKWYIKQYHDVYKIKMKILDEETKLFFKSGNKEYVKELRLKRRNLNKEIKKLKNEIKEKLN